MTRDAVVSAAARPAGRAPRGTDAQVQRIDLGSVFREHRRTIFLYLLRRTGDADRAEDLTQEVFADAVEAVRELSSDRSLLAWLYTVADRRAIDAARKDRRTAPRASLDEVSIDLAERESAADLGAVVEAVRTLPANQRAVVLMRLFEGRSFAEIGLALGAAESACRMRFSRGLQTLRATLGQARLVVAAVLLGLGKSDFQLPFGYI